MRKYKCGECGSEIESILKATRKDKKNRKWFDGPAPTVCPICNKPQVLQVSQPTPQ